MNKSHHYYRMGRDALVKQDMPYITKPKGKVF